MIFVILAIAMPATLAILAWVTGVVAGSAALLGAKNTEQRIIEDGFLGAFGCFTGLFVSFTAGWIGNRSLSWLNPVWISLALAILLPLIHEINRRFRPIGASLDFSKPGRSTPSKWNWLLFPFPFAISYEVLTWFCWVPLNLMGAFGSHLPAQDAPFVEGQLIAFGGFRIGSVLLLALICFAFLPRACWREVMLVAALAGAVASALDRFCWNWFNSSGGFPVALFGIPIVASGILILLDRYIRSRWPREARA